MDGIYILSGLIWSIKEWYSYVKETTKAFSSEYDSDKSNTELIEMISDKVDVKDHWYNITTWIVYFPYFILAWALTDPIKKLAKQFTFVYEKISSVLVNKAVNKLITEREVNANNKRNT